MSTTGIELKTRHRALGDAVELVSSMRFAITMLVMIMIAAIIGTVLSQNQPIPNYINQFGPFWAEIFGKLGLYAVYSAWWFILILTLLLASTSLCIVRNAPKMLRDMRSWRENVREESLRNFHHKTEWSAPLTREALAAQCAARLVHAGYAAKVVDKGHGLLVAAKKGAANKFGYIFAHSAIIVILVGGMLDSDLPIQFQEKVLGKRAYQGGGTLISQIPAEHKLGLGNPSYRGNTFIPEGQSSDIALIPRADGNLLQPLPFTIELKKFIIDFYSTGMPKLFASEVVIRDHETGKTFPATIKVNEPLIYRGVAVYQSSFEDGGTRLKLSGFPMSGTGQARFAIEGEVGSATKLANGSDGYTVEWSGFRPFNVENVGSSGETRGVAKGDSLNEALARTLDQHSGSAAKHANNKDLKNVGPSVQYKLRDKTGQAREYQNYMQPVTIDGAQVFLAGVRANPDDAFSYLRIPADDAYTVKEWMRLRAALADPVLRARAAADYARIALAGKQGTASNLSEDQLRDLAVLSLEAFAGKGGTGGYLGLARLIEQIPAARQENQAMIFMKILNGSLWALWDGARAAEGLAAVERDEAHGNYLQLAATALSDSVFYGAPVYLQLDEFVEVKASVLQVTRSPGKPIVYLGCLLLVLGVFAMFYIRERRLWVWIRAADGGAHALMAMSTQRKTLDFEQEFNDLTAKLPQLA